MTQQRNNENNENNKGGRQKCMVSILEGFKGKETKDGRTCIVQLHPWRCETWTRVGFDQRYCFMKGHVDGVHFGDQLTWSTVLAPWSYFCWLNASNGPHQKVDRPQLDLVGGDCQSNRGRRWGTQVLACAIEVVWKIMKWCSFLDQVRLLEEFVLVYHGELVWLSSAVLLTMIFVCVAWVAWVGWSYYYGGSLWKNSCRDYVGIHIPRNETTSPLWEW